MWYAPNNVWVRYQSASSSAMWLNLENSYRGSPSFFLKIVMQKHGYSQYSNLMLVKKTDHSQAIHAVVEWRRCQALCSAVVHQFRAIKNSERNAPRPSCSKFANFPPTRHARLLIPNTINCLNSQHGCNCMVCCDTKVLVSVIKAHCKKISEIPNLLILMHWNLLGLAWLI